MKGRVLIIAGSDSGGGAGIQADLKTVTCLNGFAMTAITALTAQNTQGVTAIHDVPADFVKEQIRVVLTDLGADCIKTGMLSQPATIHAICDVLDELDMDIPMVVDPVMVAKGGASLLAQEALAALKARLIPRATVLTPNVPEAEALSGLSIKTAEDMKLAAEKLFELGPKAVLMKGGHMDEDTETVCDYLFEDDGTVHTFDGKRIQTRHTHGTGCTTASAIACGVAQGLSVEKSVERAKSYVFEAIKTAPGFGAGHGPLNHAHTVKS
ncbi:bifunctional hydroxymethylpyrimidine kinase/phosphomethylpyrimidine kinase [Terasakiella sp. A23]|uniref:bifunctional hydroxymethylpyrimidine kinase/phosphomethylpyrimidine kinase n=1 Tax=Terasakiella sp. FCG-A23 TaxID=3080561 RepID=UPI00295412D0|nr:bifunctional hydroxymethylpyrimidine kinase/phosphomethylpyrimidine kinase [Terasakiella sp. A23]MDV7339123.1 bifunctional hydroxymethylpyrimidine kinase/phosphomethylpyrimidine kinase [Terasakiella sp. A23]